MQQDTWGLMCLLTAARGLHLDGRASARAAIQEAHAAGARICAFFCESILSCAGQVWLQCLAALGHQQLLHLLNRGPLHVGCAHIDS